MKSIFYRVSNTLGINKRAVCFLIAGVIITLVARGYAHKHFIVPAEKHLAKFKASSRELKRYDIRGVPTYDELITRAQYFDDYYRTEAKNIRDVISFPEVESEFVISPDERFAHIKDKQCIDRFRDMLSEKIPGVNVYGKFFEVKSIHTDIHEMNKHLRRMWLLKMFLERMLDGGFDKNHFVSITVGDPGASSSLQDLMVFQNIDLVMIEAHCKLSLDEVLKAFQVLRKSEGYFFVEDIQIQVPDGHQVVGKGKLNVRFKLLYLELVIKDSITYAPMTPTWRLHAND
ncbi:MAG: hypothetical protein DWB56_06240 [Candidatus Jettenia sp.]|uniref:Uncharacterized protein n=1 Tax=Candidatus Jettenia caeni TaxID=247490 RepID=I3IR51_9BACT|nr:hypothetical protein [Candidatus Jettenia sp. AMX1]MBC6928553.1 hypothetical protein [Candidatus Jettenia sp.]WKZ15606.1 MAG: hypothetical protein QY317_17075 [Candidatus Jettenia caeni]KAA0249175.1 MAG: hypothetical protein EDM77_09760 [Candidatus Jettenia sp. AMX1]MCE7879772.1 hypothetical protein [Candidatus Jettenia sp. AMX1]MCQ3926453.1 hypothetical protein [Candidatus Jettenia sp.]